MVDTQEEYDHKLESELFVEHWLPLLVGRTIEKAEVQPSHSRDGEFNLVLKFDADMGACIPLSRTGLYRLVPIQEPTRYNSPLRIVENK